MKERRAASRRSRAASGILTSWFGPRPWTHGPGNPHRASLELLLTLLERDPSPLVRERAALSIGLLRLAAGEASLIAASRRAEPANVRAAAALAAGVFDRESIVARIMDMPDEGAVRELLRERLKWDSRFRLLRCRLSKARHLELHALMITRATPRPRRRLREARGRCSTPATASA